MPISGTRFEGRSSYRPEPHARGGALGLGVCGGGVARVYGPDGALLTAQLDGSTEGIVYAGIDLAMIDLSKKFPTLSGITAGRTSSIWRWTESPSAADLSGALGEPAYRNERAPAASDDVVVPTSV
ncbi:hypothetical protein [Rhodococcus qingshengii]|uniref:hypothetical protein n=1 Tax=Rhodococcus qingshengii TaxID=334542 RepID=UPI001C22792A|nr:hypothetical protein [Rhodococcus qingshengii]QXC46320.1 hypothetical protein KSE96_31840 [Rhodococcus qingshengii]